MVNNKPPKPDFELLKQVGQNTHDYFLVLLSLMADEWLCIQYSPYPLRCFLKLKDRQKGQTFQYKYVVSFWGFCVVWCQGDFEETLSPIARLTRLSVFLCLCFSITTVKREPLWIFSFFFQKQHVSECA